MRRRDFLVTALTAVPVSFLGCAAAAEAPPTGQSGGRNGKFEVTKTEAEWRKILTPEQFRILREEHTERPGASPLNGEHREGTFHCAGCDLPLYSSKTKFESGTGWPSFNAPLANAIGTSVDRSLLAIRTEVHCRRCGGHLGHVFDDGPPPTGMRYCMNGGAMTFKPKAQGA